MIIYFAFLARKIQQNVSKIFKIFGKFDFELNSKETYRYDYDLGLGAMKSKIFLKS